MNNSTSTGVRPSEVEGDSEDCINVPALTTRNNKAETSIIFTVPTSLGHQMRIPAESSGWIESANRETFAYWEL